MESMFGKVRVAIDTSVFLYYLERNPEFAGISGQLLQQIEAQQVPAITSVLTIAEIATGPYKRGNHALAAALTRRLSLFRNLEILDVTPAVALTAARIRAGYAFRLPDALHLATALEHDAETFVTNDHRLQ